jgi:expansin (peptidoglycan-binding protein)
MQKAQLALYGTLLLCACQPDQTPMAVDPDGVPSRGGGASDVLVPVGPVDSVGPVGANDGGTTDATDSTDTSTRMKEVAPTSGIDATASLEVQHEDASQPEAGVTVDSGPPGDLEPPIITPPVLACPAATNGQIDLWVPGPGNCSYPQAEVPQFAAAVDSELYAQGAACGSCLEVTSARGQVIATVVDQYPVSPGPNGHKISLSNAALTKVTAPGTSLAVLSWRWAPCPTASTSIMAELKEGSGQFYWEVMLQNATNRVAKVEFISAAEPNWQEAKREPYGYFSHPSARGLPTRLRLTDTVGNVKSTDNLQWPTNPVTKPIPLNVQFAPACSL